MSESAPLAIVGISCLFPKADDLQAYWSNIKNGVDAITPVPELTHWRADDFFNADPKAPDQTYGRRGGFISPVNFNPLEFGIAPKDIEAIDTTQLLGMVAAKQALVDAGYGDKPFNRDRTSVILGVTGALELVIPLGARLGHPIWRRALKEAGVNETVTEDVVQRIADSYVPWQENSFPGLLGNVAAGRIASRLDLGGTNCVVDAACASSLAALHLAWLELTTGRSDMVITGGVDTFNNIFMYMCFSKTPALSPTGDAKPFDRDCDGTILGEGLGILVLKRLADAERDGDKIYAVLKGLGASSDGRGNAIYAPRAGGQKEALKRAYDDAQTSPDTIELIEAHGTGTKVGDATEISALTEVFRAARPEGTWTALGSVKSQIGHAKAAAGVAGLIKAALALEHKVLPPTIKVSQPLDEAAPGRSPFYVNTQKRPWLPRPSHPRRAGVSAFGFGGTNFHCVLEEHGGQRKQAGWDGDVEIIALSAEQLPNLRAKVAALSSDLPWPEVRQLAHRSRAEFQHEAPFRLLLPVSKGASLATLRDAALAMLDQHPEKTHWSLPGGVAFGSGATRGKLGVLFPGQGSQYASMFRDLACQFPEVLVALAAADRIFTQEHPELGPQRLSDFIYPHPAFTDEAKREQEEALKATDVAQPALGAISLGALNLVNYFGVTPQAAAGHSYGELPALCGAGRLQPESLHRLSNVRGRLMACRNGHSDRGSMLAVQASEEVVAKLVGEASSQLVIANRNSPSQFVLAGPKLQIHQAAEEAARQSIRARILPVSAAFHSTLVADAKEPFSVALQGISFGEGHIPVYANSTAKAYPGGAIQTRELLANQMVQPVNFIEQIETMFADGVTTFLELGPSHVLSDLTHSILQGKDVETIALDSSRGTRSGTFDLAVALCRLAALGHATDLTRWEVAPPAKPAVGSKPALTIPVSGANVRNPRPQRPPVKPASPAASNSNGTHALQQTPILAPTNPSMQTPLVQSAPVVSSQTHIELPADVSAALQIAQQGMLTLQKLQEQTAQLHRQFLEGQETARRTLEALLSQRRDLLNPGGSGVIRSAPSAVPASVERADSSTPAKSELPASGSNGKNVQHLALARSEPPVQAQSSQAPVATVAGVSVVEASQTLLNVVSDKTGYPVEMLNLDMGLDTDLGVDSIKRVEIMAAIRTQLPGAPEIKPEHLGSLQTLQQVVDFLTAGADLRKSTPAEVQRELQAMPAAKVASAGVDSAEASQVLLGVVSEKTGYPAEMLNLEMGLDSDLGVDSIKRVEIMAAIHTRLPAAPEIKPEHLGTLQTLQQVVDFLISRKAQTVSAQTEVRSLKPAGLLKETPSLDAGGHKDASEALDRQIVRPAQLGEGDNQPAIVLPQGSMIWVTDDTTDLSAMVAANLRELGFNVRHANPAELLKSNRELLPSALVILWPAVHGGDAFLKQAFQLIQTAGASLRSAGRNGAGILTSVSRLDGVFGFGALNGKCDPISGGLAGLVKTARHEWPEVNCKALDVSPELAASPAVAAQIVQEMFRLGPVEVGLSAGSRFGLSIQTVPFVGNGTAPVLNSGDLVVVTGGARGITATTALQLARTYKPHFVMLGRSQLAESEPAWLSGLQSEADIKKALLSRTKGDRSPRRIEARYREIIAQREIREHLRQMCSAGATALYRTVDVRDAAQIDAVIKEMRAEFGPVHGLIHGAGVLADKRIEDKTGEQFDLVYSTKVAGLKNLLVSVADDDLKLLALFSSYSARFGRTGQADYAAANEVLNKMAQVESRRRPQCRVVSFNWGPWNGGMVSEGLRQIFESEGVRLIEPEAGSKFFVRELATPSTDAVEVVALAASSAARSPVSGRNGNGRHDHSESVPAASSFQPAFDREVSVSALPCLESHVLHGRAVLPAALMIEWLAHGALHGNPGMMFHGFDDFKVLKGIVLEPGSSVQVSVQAASSHAREGGLVVPVRLVSQAGERLLIHARADILLTDTLPDAPAPAFDVHRNGCTSAVYGDGRLFHGPHFQSIELLETCSKTEIAALVKGSPAPKHWFENPLRPGWLADPLALDASFQMLILWSCEQREAPSLPCAIARFRQFTPAFPKNGSRVTAQVTSGQSPVAKADLLFFDRQGGLLALAQGYECVVDPGLRDAFRLNCLSLET